MKFGVKNPFPRLKYRGGRVSSSSLEVGLAPLAKGGRPVLVGEVGSLLSRVGIIPFNQPLNHLLLISWLGSKGLVGSQEAWERISAVLFQVGVSPLCSFAGM